MSIISSEYNNRRNILSSTNLIELAKKISRQGFPDNNHNADLTSYSLPDSDDTNEFDVYNTREIGGGIRHDVWTVIDDEGKLKKIPYCSKNMADLPPLPLNY